MSNAGLPTQDPAKPQELEIEEEAPLGSKQSATGSRIALLIGIDMEEVTV